MTLKSLASKYLNFFDLMPEGMLAVPAKLNLFW